MSSENLSSAKNQLKGNLGGSWDILDGCEGNYTDLGVARRFGGAAAAYSLRDVGAMNGSVVRVRREPQDTDATINDEENFSANQVQSGALEDWVNGKLEATLPCDVATAYQAYSLRKVKDSYSGNAVRIRRGSDDIEVDVAFDGSGKVSSSSAITNASEEGGESGSTSATDLNGFLTEQSFFYQQNDHTSSSSYNLSRNSTRWDFSKVSSVSDGTTTKAGEILQLQATGTNGTFLIFPNPAITCTGQETTITFDYLFPSSNSDTDIYINVSDTNTTSAASPTVSANDINGAVSGTWATASHTFSSAVSGQPSIRLTNSPTSLVATTVTPDAGDKVYITNLKISTVKADAFVHTWYDQAGSNNATQTTAGSQPKIAESGALLTDGLKFDGTDDMLTDSDVGAMQASDGMSTFTVHKKRVASTSTSFTTTNPQYLYHLAEDALATTVLAHRILGGQLNAIRANPAGDDYLSDRTTKHLITTTKNLSTAIGSSGFQNHFNATTPAESTEDSGTSYDSTTTEFTIGAQDGVGGSPTRFYDGEIEELIIYKSAVTTDNRFEIENNINNYYGLYNDENEVSASFTNSNGTLSNESKDGFTIEVAVPNAFIAATFVNSGVSGDVIYASFNADLTGGSGGNADPSFHLSNGLTTASTSNDEDVVSGFNSFVLTATGDFDRIRFTEGSDNRNFTISDFRVSRIARNAFVQSWYDQSGNARTMAQTTAADQPHIVENGGICKDPSRNNPTVKFVNVGTELGSTFLAVSSNIPTLPAGMTQFFVASTKIDPTGKRCTFAGGASDSCIDDADLELRRCSPGGGNRNPPSLEISTNTNSLLVYGTNSSLVARFDLNASSENATSAFTGTINETAFQFLGENSATASGTQGDDFGLQGTISEAILYTTDLDTETTTVKNNLNNHYNIY